MQKSTLNILLAGLMVAALFAVNPLVAQGEVRDIGSRLELFVDHFLIDELDGTRLKLHPPQPAEAVLKSGAPVAGYMSVLKDGAKYRMYYGGMQYGGIVRDGLDDVVLYAESDDGINWSKPNLGLFEFQGTRDNNAIIVGQGHIAHTFSPFIDTRPGTPDKERFKALGGLLYDHTELLARRKVKPGYYTFVSADGIQWKPIQTEPVITKSHYPYKTDSTPPAVFWSQMEQCYVAYLRIHVNEQGEMVPCWEPEWYYRWVGRTTSKDFLHWSKVAPVDFGDAPKEQLYTSEVHPYFRAPHIYVGVGTRFFGDPIHRRHQALTDTQLSALEREPQLRDTVRGNTKTVGIDIVDNVLLASRGGNKFDRTFMEALIRPGLGLHNWTNRANYAYAEVVPTGPGEMSLYVTLETCLPTNYVRRYTLRTDGFISVNAPYTGGEMVMKPFTFSGKELVINYSTSAGGSVRVEIWGESGEAVAGYSIGDCDRIIGDEIERVVTWKGGSDLRALVGKPIRLRFKMKDADLYSIRFR